MRVLLTHRFFWPDTAPYALMLRAIGDALAEAGHEVHVLSSIPSYRRNGLRSRTPRHETLGALSVRRCWVVAGEKSNLWRRVVNVLLYCFALFREVMRLRPDVVMASTFPPIVAAWTASLAARLVGARFIYHIQDIHPEVSAYSGGRLGRGLVGRLFTALDNQTLHRASAIVVLSGDMAETLCARGLGNLPIHIINNFSLDLFGEADEPPTELRKAPGKRRVIFSGNLGRFQNLPLLAEGVARLFVRHPDLELMFLGDGTTLPELRAQWGDHPQVTFGPFLPFAQARSLIAEADIGLVSLAPGIYRVAYPSKVLTYLGLGVPVLALIEPESELARVLSRNGWGRVPTEATPDALASALQALLETNKQLCPINTRAGLNETWAQLVMNVERRAEFRH